MSKKIITVILLAIVCLSFFLIFAKKQIVSPKIESRIPEKLSKIEFEQLRSNLFQLIERKNPRSAINSLKDKMESSQAVLNSCHELLHEIGFKSYEKYNDFAAALTYKDDICVSAYIHGVIEGYFYKVKNITEAIKSTCKNYPIGRFITWECYHGVGHGLMYYSNNNVLKALEGCKLYGNNFDRSACSNGVYMENFNADSIIHPSQFLNSKNPFYPCDVLKQDKKDCYMNAPIYYLTLNNYDYNKAFKWCDSASEYKNSCFFGLASQMARRNMDDPKFVEQSCERYGVDIVDPCVYGLVSWYVSYYASLEEAGKMCNELEGRNKPRCRLALDSFRDQF